MWLSIIIFVAAVLTTISRTGAGRRGGDVGGWELAPGHNVILGKYLHNTTRREAGEGRYSQNKNMPSIEKKEIGEGEQHGGHEG